MAAAATTRHLPWASPSDADLCTTAAPRRDDKAPRHTSLALGKANPDTAAVSVRSSSDEYWARAERSSADAGAKPTVLMDANADADTDTDPAHTAHPNATLRHGCSIGKRSLGAKGETEAD